MTQQDRLLVQIATYNTNLQGTLALPQDLVDWLAPTLQVSHFLQHEPRAPDIVAVGFQELLPLYLGLPGLSKSVLENKESHILSQIEAHAPNKERYSLVAKIVNVGTALLVYARDDGVARKITDVQTQWTGCGLGGYMGNKSGVGIRFRIPAEDGGAGETYTFIGAHLTPHAHKLKERLRDWDHIVRSLVFPPSPGSSGTQPTTLYSTSHLFVLGDLNFRVVLPADHPHAGVHERGDFAALLERQEQREEIKEHDQLLQERKKGTVFVGLREGEFWNFKCSYKYHIGEVDRYAATRAPSWTDRIMYATHTDSPDKPDESNITNLLYTSIPSYTTSDHKPIVALLLLPAPPSSVTPATSPPLLRLPTTYDPKPSPYATFTRYLGSVEDRIVGTLLFVLTLIGAGSAVLGIANFFVGLGAWSWWRARGGASAPTV